MNMGMHAMCFIGWIGWMDGTCVQTYACPNACHVCMSLRMLNHACACDDIDVHHQDVVRLLTPLLTPVALTQLSTEIQLFQEQQYGQHVSGWRQHVCECMHGDTMLDVMICCTLST